MKTALFRTRPKNTGIEDTWVKAGECTIHVVQASTPSTVVVTGRVTVDSSPHLRSTLLDLLHRGKMPKVVIDLSAVSYMDTSGIATLLEALKAARDHSVSLHVDGMSGQVRTLAEIAQVDTIFRAWGSEVAFR